MSKLLYDQINVATMELTRLVSKIEEGQWTTLGSEIMDLVQVLADLHHNYGYDQGCRDGCDEHA